MIKRRWGGSVFSRDFVAQTNELLFKVLLHNVHCLIIGAEIHPIDATLFADHKKSDVADSDLAGKPQPVLRPISQTSRQPAQ